MKLKNIGICLFLLAVSGFCDGSHFHLKVKNIQFTASYSGGPAKGLYAYCEDLSNGGNLVLYRYLFDQSGNSLEYGKGLLSMLLTAKTLDSKITIVYQGSKATDATTGGVMHSIQF